MRNKENIFYKEISGEVILGKQIGRTLGFPTANIKMDPSIVLEQGTYRINGIIDNKILPGAGVFLGENNIFEAHFMNYSGNLYGKKISIILLYKIRENISFNSVSELKKEIKEDLQYIEKNPDYVLTFGTFDTFHLGHQFYLEQAKTYGDKLVTIIAKSTNVEKFKGHKPNMTEKERLNIVREVGISDIVHIGDTKNPLKWLELYDPRVICLGYDQKGFVDLLKEYRDKNKLNIKIIRIAPFEEKLFKSSILNKSIS